MAAPYSAPGFVSYNGRPLLQSDTISLKIDTDNKDVNTLLLGRAGHSAGPVKATFTVSAAVPAGGLEIDWPTIALQQAQIALTFTIAGRAYNATGDVRNVELSTSTDKANAVSFEFHARLTQILAV